ncbi:MAG TPA: hypothetical protein VHW23_20310 [Kofleriaceae bacterium]|jgi:hypothetical protein|nr:hypothetical protein [Kofleriaceae bacterium]
MSWLGPRGLIGAILALAGCGTARMVQRTPTGGMIELEGDHNKAMEQANEEMAAACTDFIIVRAGDEPVTPTAPPDGAPVATVYRVHYQCGDAAPTDPTPRHD